MLQEFSGQLRSGNVIKREITVAHERDQIVRIAFSLKDLPDPPRGLVVGRARRIDEDGMENPEITGLPDIVVSLLVRETSNE